MFWLLIGEHRIRPFWTNDRFSTLNLMLNTCLLTTRICESDSQVDTVEHFLFLWIAWDSWSNISVTCPTSLSRKSIFAFLCKVAMDNIKFIFYKSCMIYLKFRNVALLAILCNLLASTICILECFLILTLLALLQLEISLTCFTTFVLKSWIFAKFSFSCLTPRLTLNSKFSIFPASSPKSFDMTPLLCLFSGANSLDHLILLSFSLIGCSKMIYIMWVGCTCGICSRVDIEYDIGYGILDNGYEILLLDMSYW